MLFILMATFAFAQEPSTIVVAPGESVTATVESFLVSRERMERLLALADAGSQLDDVKLKWMDTIDALDRCADSQDASARILGGIQEDLVKIDIRLTAARRQRNVAFGVAGAVGLASAGALLGAYATSH